MKKYIVLLLAVILTLGCSRPAKEKKEILAKINNYEITLDEFEEEFKGSAYGRNDTSESRKEFLSNLINRKLILQDAQGKGLDKDKDFLKMIERFWEQSLLKLVLDKKTKDIAGSTFVSDKIIEETYQRMRQEGKADRTYDQMYNQIKWEITRTRGTQAMNEWVSGLRKNADIKVNYDLLKQGK